MSRRLVMLTDLPLEWEYAPVSRLMYLARIAAEAGIAVQLVGSESKQLPEHEPFTIHALPVSARGKMQAIFPFRSGVCQAVRGADGVLVRGYWLAFFVLLSAWLQRKPLRMLDFHGSTWREQPRTSMYRVVSRLMEAVSLRLATHILAVSEGTATHVPASLQRKVSVLENGVDVDQFDAQKNPPLTDIPAEILDGTVFRLGLVARFGEWLELDTVRDALALVSHPVKLVVFGDGPVLDAAQLEGNSTVWLAGRRPHAEVRSFLTRHCDAAIVPYNPAFAQSQVPGFFSSRKVREYLAAGLPIFFPDISGLKGELRSNPKALMYEAGAAPTLAALINRLIEEPDWHRALSVAAKRDGAAYAWDVLAEQSGFTELIKIWGES